MVEQVQVNVSSFIVQVEILSFVGVKVILYQMPTSRCKNSTQQKPYLPQKPSRLNFIALGQADKACTLKGAAV